MRFRPGALRLAPGVTLDWLQLGSGGRKSVIVPGAGDGLWTVRQTAVHLAWRYRRRLLTHQLLILGRREPIPAAFGPDQFADDYICAVEQLAWGPAIWECISAGGPIGQVVAQRRPDLVSGLVLASTTHRVDRQLNAVLDRWRRLVHARRWADLYWNIGELNRRPEIVARYRPLKPLLRIAPRPRNAARFLHLIDGLERVDNSAVLPEITCPTLVIGGQDDRIISADLQREMAGLIPNSRLILFEGHGHAAHLEHPDTHRVYRRFSDEVQR